MRILHLSDTHLRQERGLNRTGVDPRESLRLMLDACAHLGRIDLVVVSGDVADDGSPEAYADALTTVGEFAAARGSALAYAIGNHDDRSGFAGVLGNGHFDADGVTDGARPRPDECVGVSEVAGHRVITLDTLVPGKGYGRISQGQLTWLAEKLATPYEDGTVLVLHHPPIALDVPVQQVLRLRNAAELASAIDGSDVRVILCGHFHLQLTGYLDRTPVIVSPGVINRIDLTTEPGAERGIRGASATIVELHSGSGPTSYVIHARDPGVGQVAYELDVAELAKVLEEIG